MSFVRLASVKAVFHVCVCVLLLAKITKQIFRQYYFIFFIYNFVSLLDCALNVFKRSGFSTRLYIFYLADWITSRTGDLGSIPFAR